MPIILRTTTNRPYETVSYHPFANAHDLPLITFFPPNG